MMVLWQGSWMLEQCTICSFAAELYTVHWCCKIYCYIQILLMSNTKLSMCYFKFHAYGAGPPHRDLSIGSQAISTFLGNVSC